MSTPADAPPNVVYVVRDYAHDTTWYASDYYVSAIIWFCIVLVCLLWCVGDSATYSRRYVRYAPPTPANAAGTAAAAAATPGDPY